MIVVPDAGPLIYLAGAGQLELLRALYARVVVPGIVRNEVVVAGAGFVGADEVAAATWIEIVEVAPDAGLLRDLDPNEAAAIPLAEGLHATLLCDDGAARAIARARGLSIVGTLGVLLRAKREGRVERVGPLIERITGLGLFVSDDLVDEILRAAGER